jgi:hypothetical protein
MGDASVFVHGAEGGVSGLATRGNESSVQTIGCESPGGGFEVIFPPIRHGIRAEPLNQRDAIISRGDGEHTRSHAFGQLNREVADSTPGAEHHQRFALF